MSHTLSSSSSFSSSFPDTHTRIPTVPTFQSLIATGRFAHAEDALDLNHVMRQYEILSSTFTADSADASSWVSGLKDVVSLSLPFVPMPAKLREVLQQSVQTAAQRLEQSLSESLKVKLAPVNETVRKQVQEFFQQAKDKYSGDPQAFHNFVQKRMQKTNSSKLAPELESYLHFQYAAAAWQLESNSAKSDHQSALKAIDELDSDLQRALSSIQANMAHILQELQEDKQALDALQKKLTDLMCKLPSLQNGQALADAVGALQAAAMLFKLAGMPHLEKWAAAAGQMVSSYLLLATSGFSAGPVVGAITCFIAAVQILFSRDDTALFTYLENMYNELSKQLQHLSKQIENGFNAMIHCFTRLGAQNELIYRSCVELGNLIQQVSTSIHRSSELIEYRADRVEKVLQNIIHTVDMAAQANQSQKLRFMLERYSRQHITSKAEWVARLEPARLSETYTDIDQCKTWILKESSHAQLSDLPSGIADSVVSLHLLGEPFLHPTAAGDSDHTSRRHQAKRRWHFLAKHANYVWTLESKVEEKEKMEKKKNTSSSNSNASQPDQFQVINEATMKELVNADYFIAACNLFIRIHSNLPNVSPNVDRTVSQYILPKIQVNTDFLLNYSLILEHSLGYYYHLLLQVLSQISKVCEEVWAEVSPAARDHFPLHSTIATPLSESVVDAKNLTYVNPKYWFNWIFVIERDNRPAFNLSVDLPMAKSMSITNHPTTPVQQLCRDGVGGGRFQLKTFPALTRHDNFDINLGGPGWATCTERRLVELPSEEIHDRILQEIRDANMYLSNDSTDTDDTVSSFVLPFEFVIGHDLQVGRLSFDVWCWRVHANGQIMRGELDICYQRESGQTEVVMQICLRGAGFFPTPGVPIVRVPGVWNSSMEQDFRNGCHVLTRQTNSHPATAALTQRIQRSYLRRSYTSTFVQDVWNDVAGYFKGRYASVASRLLLASHPQSRKLKFDDICMQLDAMCGSISFYFEFFQVTPLQWRKVQRLSCHSLKRLSKTDRIERWIAEPSVIIKKALQSVADKADYKYRRLKSVKEMKDAEEAKQKAATGRVADAVLESPTPDFEDASVSIHSVLSYLVDANISPFYYNLSQWQAQKQADDKVETERKDTQPDDLKDVVNGCLFYQEFQRLNHHFEHLVSYRQILKLDVADSAKRESNCLML